MVQRDAQLEAGALWRILDVTRQLGAPIDLDEMLGHVIDAAREVLQADRGTVFLYDPSTHELYSKIAHGTQEIRIPADRGIAGECAQSREVLNIPDCYADPRFNQKIDRETGYHTRCLLTVPLIGVDDELVGVMQVLNKLDGVFEAHDERLATVLAAQCAVALQRARLIEEHLVKQKLERDLAVARDIQQRVLPTAMPALVGYDIAGWSEAAEQTGGDIYDAIRLSDQSGLLLLCDATGHGIGPALSVTQVRAMFRIAARLGIDLETMFRHINDQLIDDLADNRFVTAFFGMLDAAGHRVHYQAGGQGPTLHLHAATGECENIEASTVPMGIMPHMGDDLPAPIELAPGDVLALISDGIFEARSPAGEEFGAERVCEILREHQNQPMSELIRTLNEEVERFIAGQPHEDDMTVVLVRRLPE